MYRSIPRLSRRDVREATSYSYEQLRVHLGRLVELEYLLVHRGGRGQISFYELLYDGGGTSGAPRVFGLIELGDVYTQVSIRELCAVYEATHPAMRRVRSRAAPRPPLFGR